MNKITIISDIHGKHKEYLRIVKNNSYTLQIGDLGFNYWFLKDIDPKKHVYFKGNHDNFDETSEHDLGKYGFKTLNNVEFFYIRGAFSIDYKYRQKYERDTGLKIWWKEEELDESDLSDAYNLYSSSKPQIMITHECPRQISNLIGNPEILREFGFNPDTFTNRTSEWLQRCYNEWQPKLWVFGHYHKKSDFYHNPAIPDIKIINDGEFATRFICLPELGTIEIDNEAKVYYKKNK